jgi:HK97 gp10 family phage protein
MPAGISIIGVPDLKERLSKLSDAMGAEYLEAAVKEGAGVIQDAIIRAAPEKTGRLKGAFDLQTTASRPGHVEMQLQVDPDAFYWRFLEYGTKFIQAMHFISKATKNRKSTAKQTMRDTFRDKVNGFD